MLRDCPVMSRVDDVLGIFDNLRYLGVIAKNDHSGFIHKRADLFADIHSTRQNWVVQGKHKCGKHSRINFIQLFLGVSIV